MVYQANKPQPNDDLDVSVTDLQQNFQTANDVFNVDHYPFDNLTASKGFHKPVHLVKEAVNPPAVAGSYTLFSKDYTPDTTGGVTDTQLFGLSGLGGAIQLSGSSSIAEGFLWTGGLLLQWGRISPNPNATNGTVTFKDRVPSAIPFPNNLFTVQLQCEGVGGAVTDNTLYVNSLTPNSFVWFSYSHAIGTTSNYRSIYWFAVGN